MFKRLSSSIWMATLFITAAGSSGIAEPSNRTVLVLQPSVAQIFIPNTKRIDFVSGINGHRYTLQLALPFQPPPTRGYGVLYVLDGDFFFAAATEAVRGHANAPGGVVVVGIGYPNDPAWVDSVSRRGSFPASFKDEPRSRAAQEMEREYDLTLPATDAALRAEKVPGYLWVRSENVGGLDDFLKTIETEVKPRVAAFARVDPSNQALFGDSFGGLATLHALFVEPTAFRTFIIGSPTIWWNNKAVLADRDKFAAVVSSGKAKPRVLVTMGGLESTPSLATANGEFDRSAADSFLRMARMVENGRELVAWLKSVQGRSGYEVADYVTFDGLGHAIAPWPALAWGIDFAFPSAQSRYLGHGDPSGASNVGR